MLAGGLKTLSECLKVVRDDTAKDRLPEPGLVGFNLKLLSPCLLQNSFSLSLDHRFLLLLAIMESRLISELLYLSEFRTVARKNDRLGGCWQVCFKVLILPFSNDLIADVISLSLQAHRHLC